MVKQTVRTYVALCILRNFGMGFIMPIYSLFLKSKGLSLLEMNLVNATFFGWCLLLELPTGALADMWGRKKCFVLSGCITALCMFVYAMSSEVWHFLIAEFVSALGSTLASGGFFAWLSTRLKQLESKIQPETVQRDTYSVTCLTGIGASLISGWLGSMNYGWAWSLAGISFLVTSACAWLWIKEDHDHEHAPTFRERAIQFWQKISNTWQYAATHPTIKFALMMTLIMYVATMAPNMQWPPYFKEQFIRHDVFGIAQMPVVKQGQMTTLWASYIWTGMMVFLAIGAQLGQWLDREGRDEKWLLLGALFVTGIGIAATVIMPTFGLTLGVFLAHESARGLYRPMYDGYLNKQLDKEDQRATGLSLGSLPMHSASVIGLVLSGVLVSRSSIPVTWIVSGIGLSIATIFLTLWARKRA